MLLTIISTKTIKLFNSLKCKKDIFTSRFTIHCLLADTQIPVGTMFSWEQGTDMNKHSYKHSGE